MDKSKINIDKIAADLDHVQSMLPGIVRESFGLSHMPFLRVVSETEYPYSRMRIVEFDLGSIQRVRLYLKRIAPPAAGSYAPEKIVAREEKFLLKLNNEMPRESVRLVAAFPKHGVTVTEECRGTLLTSVLHTGPYRWRSRFDSKRREEMHYVCGGWLRRFHDISEKKKSNLRPWYNFISGEMIWRARQLSKSLPEHAGLFDECRRRFVDDLCLLERNGLSHIYHGDFAPHNIFYDGDAIQVIDFTGIKRGHGIADIINYLSSIAPRHSNPLFSRVLFRRFCKSFLAGYGPVDLPDPRVSDLLLVLQSIKRLLVLDSMRKNSGHLRALLALPIANSHLSHIQSYVLSGGSHPSQGHWPYLHLGRALLANR